MIAYVLNMNGVWVPCLVPKADTLTKSMIRVLGRIT